MSSDNFYSSETFSLFCTVALVCLCVLVYQNMFPNFSPCLVTGVLFQVGLFRGASYVSSDMPFNTQTNTLADCWQCMNPRDTMERPRKIHRLDQPPAAADWSSRPAYILETIFSLCSFTDCFCLAAVCSSFRPQKKTNSCASILFPYLIRAPNNTVISKINNISLHCLIDC